jgi:hypothetical protein
MQQHLARGRAALERAVRVGRARERELGADPHVEPAARIAANTSPARSSSSARSAV